MEHYEINQNPKFQIFIWPIAATFCKNKENIKDTKQNLAIFQNITLNITSTAPIFQDSIHEVQTSWETPISAEMHAKYNYLPKMTISPQYLSSISGKVP